MRLYVANDFGAVRQPSMVAGNRPEGWATDDGSSGLLLERNAMGIGVGDVNADGSWDLTVPGWGGTAHAELGVWLDHRSAEYRVLERPKPVSVVGSAVAVPPVVLTNEQVVERFGLEVDAAWIEARTGIRSRHWLAEGQTTSDLAAEAAREALRRADVAPGQVDQLILATVTPDLPSPSTATITARKVGLRCMAFDLSAACAGFLYGVDLGISSIHRGARQVLVVAADARSRWIDKSDHRSVVLFGDGAAAVVLAATDRPGFESVWCGAEGDSELGAWVPAGGTARPASAATVAAGEHYVHIAPSGTIFERFVRHTLESCERALSAAGCTLDDIDMFVTHQGNDRLVERLADALGLPPHKALKNIAHHGNTSGAALPMGLIEGMQDGRIARGSTLLLSSVGAGCTFGAAVYRC